MHDGHMEASNPDELMDRYLEGTASPQETQLVERAMLGYMEDIRPVADRELHSRKIKNWSAIRRHTSPRSLRGLVKALPYSLAASVLIAAFAAIYYFQSAKPAVTDIAPGYNQATLTLANGTKINLDSAKFGIQINDHHIVYNDKTPLNVILSGEGRSAREGAEGSLPTSLALTTPKGGQYQIILSDGTKVWLNAASTLKYPSRFSGEERVVELEGEAYFLVAKSEKQKAKSQFVVKSKNQSTTVLGTEFNINSYDPAVKTTLVTGAVRITNFAGTSVSLVPNEESVLNGTSITKQKADIQTATAWKNGKFRFIGETLGGAMQQLSRWYDIEVVFEDETLKAAPVSAIISRQKNLSTVLEIFEKAGLQFQLHGRTLTIEKK